MFTHPTDSRLTVFEADNEDLREVYITSTSMSIYEAMAEFERSLPAPVRHWKPERQHIHFRSLEFDLSKDQAADFIKRRMAQPTPAGWKLIVDAPARTRAAA